jgi:hypothetical protein
METMTQFFEWINSLLGVQSGGELVFHPVFIGSCVALFVYGLVKGFKWLYLPVATVLGGGVIYNYLYPQDSSQLGDLLGFLGAMGALALVVVYFGFIRN